MIRGQDEADPCRQGARMSERRDSSACSEVTAGPGIPAPLSPGPLAPSSSLDVLVVDDDPDTRANLCDILELDGHRVETASTAAEVLGRADWSRYAAILLDRKLPDASAEEFLPRLRQLAPEAAI